MAHHKKVKAIMSPHRLMTRMSKTTKRVDKLPPGQFLIIRMGDQYFAGKKRLPLKKIVRYYVPGLSRYREEEVQIGWDIQFTFSDDLTKAKKFRRLKQAQSACDVLNRHYSGLLKANVEALGGKNVHSSSSKRKNS